jgi:23S rRNA G2069 N7-methylase RlmK/C1962 C5-methylase RlmI
VFTVENGFAGLVRAAEGVLTEGGGLFCSTNQRTLPGEGFRRLIAQGLAKPAGWRMEERRMPADFTGEQYLKACWVDRR